MNTYQDNSIRQPCKQDEISLADSASAFYLLTSALTSFLIIRLITTSEIIIALGTIVFAVIGMWCLAIFYRLRLIVRSMKQRRKYDIKESKSSISGGIPSARFQ
jgi:hypothetical protein